MKNKSFDDFLKDDETRRLVNQEIFILQVTEAIIGYMKDTNISRVQLAERMGKSKSQVTQLLSGSRNLTLRSLADVALALGVDVSFNIIEGKDHQVAPALPKTHLTRQVKSGKPKTGKSDKVEIEKSKKDRELPLASNG